MNHQLQVSDEEEEEEEVFQENGIENLQTHYENQQLPQSLYQKPAKWANFTACELEFNKVTRRMKPKRAKTDVIEVHGGRIIRATGRKDRHSKVSTAKGPKDRRVRLSPNTAIQFYDVQDRLGYDRPSKAIDWLIKEAKAAIDALGEFPNNCHCTKLNAKMQYSLDQDQSPRFSQENRSVSNTECGVQDNQQEVNHDIPIHNFNLFSSSDGSKIPFFSEIQSYPHGHFFNFQSLQVDKILSSSNHHQDSFLATTSIPFNSNSNMEMTRSRRSLNENITSSNSPNGDHSSLNILAHHLPSILNQNQVFSHREPLQSSFFPLTNDPLSTQLQTLSYGFSNDGFSGVTSSAARIQGEEEQGTLFSAS